MFGARHCRRTARIVPGTRTTIQRRRTITGLDDGITTESVDFSVNFTPITGIDYGADEPPDGLSFAQIDAEVNMSCGVQTSGFPACWGRDNYGQLSVPTGDSVSDVDVSSELVCVLSDDSGQAASCAGLRRPW